MARATKREYDTVRGQLQDALQNASADQQDYVQKYIESARNYSGANPINNASQRDFETAVYKNALNYLNTGAQPVGGASTSSTNIFGGRNHREVVNDAGAVWNDFVTLNNKNNNSTETSRNAGTTSRTGAGSWYVDIMKGLDPGWGLEGDDFNSRANGYIQAVIDNLTEAQTKQNVGAYLSNVADPSRIESDIASLRNIQTNLGNAKDPNAVLRSISSIVRKYSSDPQAFKDYFNGVIPQLSAADKKKQELIAQHGYANADISGWGQWARDYAKNKNYNFLSKDGKIYAFDKDYNLVGEDGTISLADDSYGQGFFIDSNGQVGYITSELNPDDYWAGAYNKAAQSLSAKFDPAYQSYNFNLNNDYTDSDLVHSVLDIVKKNNPNASQVAYADVSNLFEGDSPVVAYTTDGSALKQGKFKELKLNDSKVRFAYKDASGNIQVADNLQAIQNIVGKFNREGFEEEKGQSGKYQSDAMRAFADVTGIDLDSHMTDYFNGQDFFSATAKGTAAGSVAGMVLPGLGNLAGAGLGAASGAGAYLITRLFRNDTIKDSPKNFVNIVIQAYEDPNKIIPAVGMTGEQFLTYIGNGNQKAILETAGKLVYEGTVKLTPEERNKFNKLIRDVYMTKYVQSNKQGGSINYDFMKSLIQYAEKGTSILGEDSKQKVTDWHAKYTERASKFDEKAQQAKEEGYRNAKVMDNDKSTKLTTSDYLRFATMAQDAASLAASFGGPVGTLAAGALGVASMGTDLVADLMDESLSFGDVAKNTAVNAGFAALGLVPGAKTGKIVKNIIKWAPKALTAIAGTALATDESVQATFKKLGDGDKKLNHEDWRNITRVFSLASGIGRGAKQDYHNVRAKVKFKNAGTGDFEIKIGNTTKTLSAEESQNFTQSLKDNKKEDAIKILTKAGFEEKDAKAAVSDRSKFNLFKKGEAKFSGEIKEAEARPSSTMDEEWNAETLRMQQALQARPWAAHLINRYNPAFTSKQRALLNMGYSPTEIAAVTPKVTKSERLTPQERLQRKLSDADKRGVNTPGEKVNANYAEMEQSSISGNRAVAKATRGKIEVQEHLEKLRSVWDKDPKQEIKEINNLVNSLRNMGYEDSHPNMQALIQRGEYLVSKYPELRLALIPHPSNATPVVDGVFQVNSEPEIPGLFEVADGIHMRKSPAKSVRGAKK